MGFHILLVEDEIDIAQAVKTELENEDYQVSLAHDGLTGLSKIRQSHFDLILLDWMLPGMTGVEICRRLRQTANQVPIIFITAQKEIADRVSGLDAGADDYLIKPFSVEELLARVRSNLRRVEQDNKNILQFADLKLNLLTREVYRGDRLLELTPKEFQVLEYLIYHPNQVLSHQQILVKVWDYDVIENKSVVEVQIRHLRKKMESEQEKRLIHNVRGIGYVLRE